MDIETLNAALARIAERPPTVELRLELRRSMHFLRGAKGAQIFRPAGQRRAWYVRDPSRLPRRVRALYFQAQAEYDANEVANADAVDQAIKDKVLEILDGAEGEVTDAG